MACGCVFVGTEIGGFREFAKNGETALLSPPADAQGHFRNLCRLINDPAMLKRIQEAGTASIRKFTRERASLSMEEYLLS
jgi:glycosyltransferase involved in cell wall biosynthesis